jgi:hypothetical protein
MSTHLGVRSCIVALYAFFPALYFFVYLSLVLPRLATWPAFPWPVPVLPIFGYGVLLIVVGALIKRSSLLLVHALGIALTNLVFIVGMASMMMPGFKKIEISPMAFEQVLLPPITLLVGSVVGFALGKLYAHVRGSKFG